MTRFVFGMVVGAGLLYVAMHYHVVRGQQGVFMVPKLETDLEAVYTDIREFTMQDWQSHPTLAAAIMESNRSQLIDETIHDGLSETVHGMVGHLLEQPAR